jgi:hypothetical protein
MDFEEEGAGDATLLAQPKPSISQVSTPEPMQTDSYCPSLYVPRVRNNELSRPSAIRTDNRPLFEPRYDDLERIKPPEWTTSKPATWSGLDEALRWNRMSVFEGAMRYTKYSKHRNGDMTFYGANGLQVGRYITTDICGAECGFASVTYHRNNPRSEIHDKRFCLFNPFMGAAWCAVSDRSAYPERFRFFVSFTRALPEGEYRLCHYPPNRDKPLIAIAISSSYPFGRDYGAEYEGEVKTFTAVVSMPGPTADSTETRAPARTLAEAIADNSTATKAPAVEAEVSTSTPRHESTTSRSSTPTKDEPADGTDDDESSSDEESTGASAEAPAEHTTLAEHTTPTEHTTPAKPTYKEKIEAKPLEQRTNKKKKKGRK